MLGDEHTTQCFITVSTQLANAEASQNVSKALGLGRVVGDLLRRLVARLDAHCDRVSRKCPLRLVHAILKIVNTRISVLQKKYKKSASRRRSHRPQHHQSRPTRPGVNHSFHFVCTMVASARACQRRPLRKTRGDWNPTCFVGKPLQVQCKKSTLCVESTRLLVLCICAGLSQSFRLSTNVNIEKAAKIFPLAFGTIVFAPFGLLMWFRTTPTLLCNQESAPNLPFASLLFHTGGCKGWLDKKIGHVERCDQCTLLSAGCRLRQVCTCGAGMEYWNAPQYFTYCIRLLRTHVRSRYLLCLRQFYA